MICSGVSPWVCPVDLWSQERGHDIHIKMVIEALRLYKISKDRNVDEKRDREMYFQYSHNCLN